jgi:plastocyanin
MTRHSARSTIAGLITGLVTALFLNGCGGGYSSTPTVPNPQPTPSPAPEATPTPAPSTVVIEITGVNGNMSFSPATASLQVGQQVRWHNADAITHTATQDGGAFDAGFISPGGTSAPITMTTAGTVRYHCQIHPSMVGALNVTR